MLYNVARLALHVMKAETRSADYINIQDGGPQEHQYIMNESMIQESTTPLTRIANFRFVSVISSESSFLLSSVLISHNDS